MSRSTPSRDPYRVLGVPRDADADTIKAAHRRQAKQAHPDAGGDEERFLAVQEAYQLLSDPDARREWDRRHMPGPMRARSGRPPRSRAASSSWTREDTTAYRPGRGRRGARGRADPRADGSGRDPRNHRHTWSAAGVPWWEDFEPKGTTPPRPAPEHDQREPTTEPRQRPDFDVYDRSSGAAWSMAARRHFRRGDVDLPSRGSFRYRGTQVVTGAEARKVAAEEAAAEQRARASATSRPTASAASTDRRGDAGAHAGRPVAAPSEGRSTSPRDPMSSPPPPSRPSPSVAGAPVERPTAPDSPAPTEPRPQASADATTSDPGAAPAGPSIVPTIVGAVAAPSAVLLGAGATGSIDDGPSALLLLLLAATVVAGGAVGRAIAARTARGTGATR